MQGQEESSSSHIPSPSQPSNVSPRRQAAAMPPMRSTLPSFRRRYRTDAHSFVPMHIRLGAEEAEDFFQLVWGGMAHVVSTIAGRKHLRQDIRAELTSGPHVRMSGIPDFASCRKPRPKAPLLLFARYPASTSPAIPPPGGTPSPATSSNGKPLMHPNYDALRNPQRKISPLEHSSQTSRRLSNFENTRSSSKSLRTVSADSRQSPKLSDLLRAVVLFECVHISIIFAPLQA